MREAPLGLEQQLAQLPGEVKEVLATPAVHLVESVCHRLQGERLLRPLWIDLGDQVEVFRDPLIEQTLLRTGLLDREESRDVVCHRGRSRLAWERWSVEPLRSRGVGFSDRTCLLRMDLSRTVLHGKHLPGLIDRSSRDLPCVPPPIRRRSRGYQRNRTVGGRAGAFRCRAGRGYGNLFAGAATPGWAGRRHGRRGQRTDRSQPLGEPLERLTGRVRQPPMWMLVEADAPHTVGHPAVHRAGVRWATPAACRSQLGGLGRGQKLLTIP